MNWWTMLGVAWWAAGGALAADVLALVPTSAFSHQQFYRRYLLELHRRGHNITVVTPNPIGDPSMRGYREIDIGYGYRLTQDLIRGLSDKEEKRSLFFQELVFFFFGTFLSRMCHAHLSDDNVLDIYRRREKFDVLVLELGMFVCFHPFERLAGGKIIGIASFEVGALTQLSLGSFWNPSYVPDIMLDYSDRLSFLQRLRATVFYVTSFLFCRFMYWHQTNIARQYFGPDVRDVLEIESTVALAFDNSHFSISYPRPNNINFIPLGGPAFHLNGREPQPLPEELREFVEAAPQGVVYFSLGTNVKTGNFTGNEEVLVETFRRLRYRVIWKWENEDLVVDLDNVRKGKWFPQVDILAHPNVKAFVTQGGLQSIGEALEYRVPMIVMPFFADQGHNAKKLQLTGSAIVLDFDSITVDSLTEALEQIVGNRTYRDNVRKLSELVKDQPIPPLEKAVWWTEYVIRHDGAPHLRSTAATLPWYQFFQLDVLAVVFLSLLLLVYLVYAVVRTLLGMVIPRGKPKKD